MKVAVIGSRNIKEVDLELYLPEETTEIISGGAKGVDTIAREFALKNNIKFKEFLPDYKKYGRYAPLKRNISIIGASDIVIAFWDGESKGTEFVIKECKKMSIDCHVYNLA